MLYSKYFKNSSELNVPTCEMAGLKSLPPYNSVPLLSHQL